ncbi:YciI family protein [Demequina silvatica]|uniref:YciI family protein n=1 Tax=Demequina silvatica TaxID=1638988 RepID=UPI0007845FD3|nr:YciI family protein [Demequina silvatica]
MSEFMLSVHHDYSQPVQPEGTDVDAMYAAVAALNEELMSTGAWVYGGGLQEPATASVVSVVDGEVTVADGPRNPLAPQLGGYWVIDVADADAARAWAERMSVAVNGPVEIRPLQGE